MAKTSAQVIFDGRRVALRRGVTTAHPDHLIVRGREELFEPLSVTFDVPVEAKK